MHGYTQLYHQNKNMSTEDTLIKNIENAIRSIRLGTKTPAETNVGYNLNKLKEVNIGLYEDLLAKYKAALSQYKTKQEIINQN